jgi:hypothetical protein
MAKSNGIKSLKQAAKLLNKHSPDGESLAYINPEEAKLLRDSGGSGIMTVSGVPSYNWLTDAITKYAPKVLSYGKQALDFGKQAKDLYDKFGKADASMITPPYFPNQGDVMPPLYQPYDDYNAGRFDNNQVGTYPNIHEGENVPNPFWQDLGGSIFQSGKEFLKGRYGGEDAIKNIGKDAMSVWMALRAKKDQEGLNNAEMEQFNKLNQRMEAAQAEFTSNIAGGGVENIPTDVSRFTEVDLPDMITTPTAAQGGRIGAFNGGIQGLMPQQGFIPQPGLMPQQGLMPPQGLNPRMGYALGDEVEQVTETVDMPQEMQMADLDDIPDWYLMDFEKLLEDFRIDNNGNNPTSINELEKWIRFKRTTVAQGGRIGAQGGGIMPLLDMGGMEKDYRQDGGFVPIGRREKADDVPARLSKNEFVFTADAVKAAGGGDIDQGAQRMYNVMKNLEAGGEISEQSQGQV